MPTSPVLDTAALCRLEEQLGDTDILCGFLRRFVAMLDQRIDRLERALSTGDYAGWMDAVLSLKTSSAMAGAHALSVHAAALQEGSAPCPSATGSRGVRVDDPAERMACLRRLAAETIRQLRAFLQQLGPTGTSSS